VWTWGAEVSAKAAGPCTGRAKWFTGFDLCALSCGASEYFQKVGADTIQRLCCEYALKRSSARRIRHRHRKIDGMSTADLVTGAAAQWSSLGCPRIQCDAHDSLRCLRALGEFHRVSVRGTFRAGETTAC
jgi:hypothetical protein